MHGLSYVSYLETNVTIITSKWSKFFFFVLMGFCKDSSDDSSHFRELQRDSFIDNRIYVLQQISSNFKLTI